MSSSGGLRLPVAAVVSLVRRRPRAAALASSDRVLPLVERLGDRIALGIDAAQ